jgi:hypothetical protein
VCLGAAVMELQLRGNAAGGIGPTHIEVLSPLSRLCATRVP